MNSSRPLMIVLTALVFLLVSCGESPPAGIPEQAACRDTTLATTDLYDTTVYCLVLSHQPFRHAVGTVLVINQETINPVFDEATIRHQLPDLDEQTWTTYRVKNQEPTLILDRLFITNRYLYLHPTQVNYIFKNKQDVTVGWNKFFKRYSSAEGLIEFSQVGINQPQNQALVALRFSYPGSTEEYLVLLTKQQNQWAIKTQIDLQTP